MTAALAITITRARDTNVIGVKTLAVLSLTIPGVRAEKPVGGRSSPRSALSKWEQYCLISLFSRGGSDSKLDSQTPVPHALCTVYILHWMLLRFMDITDGICNDTYFRETLHVYIFMVRTLYGFPFGKHVSLSILNTRSEKGVKGVQFKYW